MRHISNYRVYYEDTDAGGVVYYANYLKFAERARTELLRAFGINQQELNVSNNILFVVRNAVLDLIKPARLDDLLKIETIIVKAKGAIIELEQNIYLEKTKLCNIKVKLVVINRDFRPIRLPNFLEKVFNKV